MATTTTKLKLTKPAQTDFYNIDDHNANSDKLDAYAVTTDADLIAIKAKNTSQDTEIANIKTAATALTLRVTNVESKNSTQDTAIGNLQAETVRLRTDFEAGDTAVTNAYKAADVVVTNAFKAADKAITDIAQLTKITADTGAAFLTVQSGEDIIAKFDALNAGVYFVVINPGAIGSPLAAGRPSGILKKPFNGKYWAVEITDYSTGRSWFGGNFNGVFKGWNESASTTDIADTEAAFKAADKVITDKAQMFKLTLDAGGAKYNISGVEIRARVLELATANMELQTFCANSTVTGFPFSGHWFGSFKRYGNLVSITAHDWTGNYAHTSYNTASSSWSAWSVYATRAEMDAKADITKAQMTKITGDGGDPIYMPNSGTMVDFITSLPKGLHTVYIGNAVTGRPPGSTNLRGYIFKVGANTASYPYGVNFIQLGSANEVGTINNTWSGQLYGLTAPTDADWNFLKDSKNAAFGGTAVPSNTLGADGDVYVQYV